ncbi:hypothetical protein NGRA_0699 [Nosema granulosis]|uniref:C-CAP/cofactor C-like domain-containing protein n=1 Tax=Nosema granulosis TaxID=83296 RepID=A0A9P6H0V5_9MICR|nr:hypothetical protein NGRA_0699 [Nosema granulosis]
MEDKILKILENQDMKLAKEAILEYESKTKEEKNEYTRCRMIDRLNLYKKLYMQNTVYDLSNVKEKSMNIIELHTGRALSSKLEIKDEHCNYEFESSLIVSNLNKQGETKKIEGLVYSDVDIVDSIGLVVGYFEASQTVYLNNVKDSTIICKSKQIRVLDSKNIILYIDVSSCVSLERSTGIEIHTLNSPEIDFANVRDFSDPFGTKNFKIIK